MKKCLFILLFFTLSFSAFSQSSDEIEIRKIDSISTAAFLKADTTTLRRLWDVNYIVRNPFNQIVTLNDIMRLITNQKITQVQFEYVVDKITINQNVAIVMGHDQPDEKTAALGVAKEVQKRRLWTNIWLKNNGEWRQIARQATNICD